MTRSVEHIRMHPTPIVQESPRYWSFVTCELIDIPCKKCGVKKVPMYVFREWVDNSRFFDWYVCCSCMRKFWRGKE